MTWLQTMMQKHNTDEAGVKQIMAARASKGGKNSPTNFANIPSKKLKEITSRAGKLSGQVRRERRARQLESEKFEEDVMQGFIETD